ncbi:MAG: metal-dependent hydrolase [Bacteroidia bacterium]
MKFTFYGHACFGVEIAGTHLLIDPFISQNPKASHIDIETLEVDYILLTHGHADHVADAKSIALRTGATIISNFEIVTWFEAKGCKGHPMSHGGQWQFPFGTVKYVSAIHSSSMPDGSYGGSPGGFVVASPEGTFYHSGDTALTYDMKLIPKTFNIDVALLCLGDNFTMGYKDAAIASDFVQCNNIIGHHFDTFGFIEIDHKLVKDHFEKEGKDLRLLEIGESYTL